MLSKIQIGKVKFICIAIFFPTFIYAQHNGFTKITSGNVVTNIARSVLSAWGDYNNDGYIDVFVRTHTGNSPTSYDKLFKNNGDGTFTEINFGGAENPDGAVAWADYNHDGYLDLFVGNAAAAGGNAHDYLYKNNGPPDYDFTSVSNIITFGDQNPSIEIAYSSH